MPEQQIPLQPKPTVSDLIYYLGFVKTIWNNRKIIVFSVITSAILGVIFVLNSPKEYVASTVMVPQKGSGSQSKVGGLAALAGINISMEQGDELAPIVYPKIVGSIPFQLELMNTPLNFQDYPIPITLLDYYTKYSKPTVLGIIKKYTIGLPGMLFSAIKRKPKELVLPNDSTNQPLLLKGDQFSVKNILDGIVLLSIDDKLGYITLTTRMPEPLAAAQLAQKAQTLMQSYITDFKIEKVKADLHFIEGRYIETKTEFEKAQVNLALVKDRNKNFTSGLPQIELDRIQSRYTIAFNVYQELAVQLEQAKIQVKKETPIFAIIEPVTVPFEKLGQNTFNIMFVFIFLGGVFGIIIIFGKRHLILIRKLWMETE